jgi:hypothetical protein
VPVGQQEDGKDLVTGRHCGSIGVSGLCAVLGLRDLAKRTGIRSLSTKIIWFA